MNKKNNKKIKVIIISVVLVTLIGIAIAFFTSRSESGKKTVRVGNLSIIYENERVFKLSNQFPVYDEDIEEDASKIEFTVRNNGDVLEYASISMIGIQISDKLKIPDFKYALYEKDTSEPVKEGNFENAGTEINVGKNIEFAADTSKDYVLYVWLSENEKDQSDLMGTTFKARIKLEGYGKKQEKLLSKKIKEDNEPIKEDKPDFSTIATDDEGLIKDVDDEGDTYYFRGAVENNYVEFNGLTWKEYDDFGYHNAGDDMLWRIVRINGDGTIRLIADGDIGFIEFNENFDDEKYVGYTFLDDEGNVQDSTIKKYLEDWYEKNMMDYDEYISTSKFCNDTSTTDEDGYIEYEAFDRIVNNNSPSFKCNKTEKPYGGLYTDLKVGLITIDEVVFAGGGFDYNESYYLYGKSGSFWTTSPLSFDNYANVWDVNNHSNMEFFDVNTSLAARPVINLRADIPYTEGNGAKNSPYLVG